jgi:hypothetical protein
LIVVSAFLNLAHNCVERFIEYGVV